MQRLRMEARDLNMGLSTFLSRYAEGRERGEGPFARAPEFDADNWEWKREFVLQKGQLRFTALCCPEDVEHCGDSHPAHVLCERCEFPVCFRCYHIMVHNSAQHVGVPMALCNDNMWGYTTSIIVQHKVRWIEAAAVLPCWTSMIVYYVEDPGASDGRARGPSAAEDSSARQLLELSHALGRRPQEPAVNDLG